MHFITGRANVQFPHNFEHKGYPGLEALVMQIHKTVQDLLH